MADTIRELIESTADLGRSALENNTVLGEPLTVDGVTVIPVYRVSYGFAGGGFEGKEGSGLTGGAGAGVSKKPVGYLTVQDGRFRVHTTGETKESALDKITQFALKKLKNAKEK